MAVGSAWVCMGGALHIGPSTLHTHTHTLCCQATGSQGSSSGQQWLREGHCTWPEPMAQQLNEAMALARGHLEGTQVAISQLANDHRHIGQILVNMANEKSLTVYQRDIIDNVQALFLRTLHCLGEGGGA